MPDALPIQDFIRRAARQQGVPEELALAVAEQESSLNPTAVGPEIKDMPGVRAIGTFQLLPSTAKGLGVDPNDPGQNIEGGVKYLRQLLDTHQGDLDSVLQSYGGYKRADPAQYIVDVNKRIVRFATASPTSAQAPLRRRRPGELPTTEEMMARAAAGPPAPAAGPPATAPVIPAPTPRPTYQRLVSAKGGGPSTYVTTPVPQPGDELGVVQFARSLAEGVDPRTQTGRENLAGMAATTALTYATGGAGTVLPWITRVLGPPVVAAVAGAAEAGTEQVLGTGEGNTMGGAAARQGAYQLGGQLIAWPFKQAARMVYGRKIATAARAALETGVAQTKAEGRALIAAAQDRVREGIEAARVLAQSVVDTTVQAGRRTTRAVRQAGTQKLAAAELENKAILGVIEAQYNDLLASPASITTASQRAREVYEGPTKKALDTAGARVAETASTGPMIRMARVQQALATMTRRAKPASIFPAEEPARGIGFLANVTAAPRQAATAATPAERARFTAFLTAQLGLTPQERLPLSGILDQVMKAPEEITFQDAHALKQLLDERVYWDRPAKAINERLTKGVRHVLRDVMAVHEPYNVANDTYQTLVTLYRQGVGKKLRVALRSNPDAGARLLNEKSPAGAQALHDILVVQGAAGGDAAAGQQAWDAARAVYAYDKIIEGGIATLSERVRRHVLRRPQFTKIVFNDEAGQQYLSNLDRLGQAYLTGVANTVARTATTKEAGRAATTAAREAGDLAVTKAVELKRRTLARERIRGTREVRGVRAAAEEATTQATADLERFTASTFRRVQDPTTKAIEAAHVAAAGPTSWWGARSLIRLLSAPNGSDLIEWAGHSSTTTERMVRLLNGQLPDLAAAALLREAVAVVTPPQPSHAQ